MTYDSLAVLEFAEAILHGDDDHREWLRAAAKAFIAGERLPPEAGAGSAATISRLTAERDGLRKALEPFGKLADAYDAAHEKRVQTFADEGLPAPQPHADGHRVSVSMGELRAAQSALLSKNGEATQK